MLSTVVATRFIGVIGNGKTMPYRIEAEDENGVSLEIVVKYSAGCQENEKSLVHESIAAMLGADLGLPVPEPFVVEIENTFINSINDLEIKKRLNDSCRYAFGSRHVPPGFAVWPTGLLIPDRLVTEAAEIFVFDAIIVNSDRRPINPNCLFSGDQLAIIDHELIFGHILFWIAPWLDGGFDALIDKNSHIFAKPYFRIPPDNLDRFIDAWESIPEGRFEQYKRALPPEWIQDHVYLDEIITNLQAVKTNIRQIVDNALEALS
jgi:hypothetical protein